MDLAEPQVLRAFLRKHGIEPKKGLGQHFLCSAKVVDAIVDATEPAVSALEIGPGPGILTSALSQRLSQTLAVELDKEMERVLAESSPQTRVVMGNALDIDLAPLLQSLPTPRALVSNLPYYITGPLLTRIAAVRSHFAVAVLMMQREVADRILSQPGNSNRGSLSVFLQLQFEISKVCDVPAGAFLPPPKVESTVLRFLPLSSGSLALENAMPSRLAYLIRSSFKMPRKTLANNLMAAQFGTRAEVEAALVQLGRDVRVRPQFLENAEWPRLLDHLPGSPPSQLGETAYVDLQ